MSARAARPRLCWEGKNIALEYRFAAGQNERLPALAAELVHLRVDMIVTNSGAAAQAARDATDTIPVVMATGGDPIRLGVVVSLARPVGNITALSLMVPELDGKRLELLKEALPHVSRIAVIWNASNPTSPDQLRQIEAAARVLGLQLHSLAVRHPHELDSVFAVMTREGADALITLGDAVLWNHRTRVVALAAQHHLPAVFDAREFADVGGLMAYGPHVPDSYRRAAVYVDKILKGAQPADLPVERAGEVRARHQSQDREGTRRDDTSGAPLPGGQGDPIGVRMRAAEHRGMCLKENNNAGGVEGEGTDL